MMWSWPGMPAAWGYALTTASMILFWTLVIFGAIVFVHYLGRENRPAVGMPLLSSCSPNGPQPAKPTSVCASSVLTLCNNRTNSNPSYRPSIRGPRHDAPADRRSRPMTRPPSDGPPRRTTLELLTGHIDQIETGRAG
jgi:hypothetical protein